MFFIFGSGQEKKVLNYDQTIICPVCGKFGHLTVVMVYSYFSLFFIPLFKWGKRYFVQTGCCGAVCELDKTLGADIARGCAITLDPSTLSFSGRGHRHCRSCGFETNADFDFCPKCGTHF